MKEQYRLFFLHIGLQRYSKNGRKPPLKLLSVFFLTKIVHPVDMSGYPVPKQRCLTSVKKIIVGFFPSFSVIGVAVFIRQPLKVIVVSWVKFPTATYNITYDCS